MAHQLKLYQTRSVNTLRRFLDEAQIMGAADAFESTVDKGLDTVYKPMPGLPDVPYACLRIPTGGGKTIMGADIIDAARGFLDKTYPLVLWLVPTTQIKSQTLEAFQEPTHPYRQQLDEAFKGQVAVFDIAHFTEIRPADLGTKVCIVMATIAALRVEEKEGRKVYEDHEDLDDHFGGSLDDLPHLDRNEAGKAVHSFANVCHLHRPLVITDEAHNANTELSYTVYQRLRPQAVVELTATPNATSSNVLVSVSAFELKGADMIKFPVVLKEHNGEWPAAVSSSVARRKSLAKDAQKEPDYIRPIALIQAESKSGTATVEEVKKHLIETDGVAEKAIAIATGDQRELDGVDLFAKDCPIEYIITKQALKEGWDCSFAYVFCSVAQVKSDKDIQQLLGRVLRMPYATKRSQDSMSKAYAHVVTDDFGRAAGELTQSLVDIGFNPLEAAAAIQKETATPKLPLVGGAMHTPELPTTKVPVAKEPDLTNVPARDAERVKFTPNKTGKGGVLEIQDELDEATMEAITQAAVDAEDALKSLALHQSLTAAAKAPSERGAVFEVPRLYAMDQGELDLVEAKAVAADFSWDLRDHPADLSKFGFNEESQTYEVFLDGKQVQYHLVKDDVATYLPGFAQDRTVDDLVGWLDIGVRDHSVKQPVSREWVRRAVKGLVEDRGFSLAQLLRGQFVLRRKLREELLGAKADAYRQGFQQALFAPDREVRAPEGSDYAFSYPADMTQYPAHSYYDGGLYKFRKHFYPKVGDLRWKTSAGKVAQEFECARVIDELDEVEFWVRNLVHKSQFWMPTSRMRTYPDFVAKLKDGRLFVVEFKGSDRFSNDESEEKRLVGALWQKASKGRGIYVMAQMTGGKTGSIRDELLAAING
ncbi:DEAD/DEAH box helicase [Stenotrophomonas sp. Ker107b]